MGQFDENLELQREYEGFWNEFHKLTNDPSGAFYNRQVYRGQSKSSYKLLPSIARNKDKNHPHFKLEEAQIIADFQRRAVPFLGNKDRPSSNTEWVILAQHYGVPTRLLDWTTNPLVALFFAVINNDDCDATLFICPDAQIIDEPNIVDYECARFYPDWEVDLANDPWGPKRIRLYGDLLFIRPRYFDRRYENQATVLSCPADPFKNQEAIAEYRIPISKEIKPYIRRYLSQIGFSYAFVYPGLEGAAKDVKQIWTE